MKEHEASLSVADLCRKRSVNHARICFESQVCEIQISEAKQVNMRERTRAGGWRTLCHITRPSKKEKKQ